MTPQSYFIQIPTAPLIKTVRTLLPFQDNLNDNVQLRECDKNGLGKNGQEEKCLRACGIQNTSDAGNFSTTKKEFSSEAKNRLYSCGIDKPYCNNGNPVTVSEPVR